MSNEKQTTGSNDSVLACKAMAGDRTALQRLLKKNWAWIRTIVRGYAYRQADMDDILQNVCLRVMLNIHALREPERFRPWAATIARREALAYVKKLGRTALHEKSLDDIHTMDVAAKDDQIQSFEIQQMMLSLPEKYRQVLLLKYVNNCTYDEIAEILDSTSNAVQMRLFRARKMLAARLENKPVPKIPRG